MSFDSANALLLDLNEYLNQTSNTDKQNQNPNQWIDTYGVQPNGFDLFAPDPDLFDSELEASADLSSLDIPFNSIEVSQPLQPAAYYGHYRGPASAFNGTVSSLSESQSGYNDYDTASFYSGHDSAYNHAQLGGAAGSLFGGQLGGASAVSTVPQHFQSLGASANSVYGTTAPSDIDLDFSEFNLSVPGATLHAAQLGGLAAPPVVSSQTSTIDTSALNSVHFLMNQAISSYPTPPSQSQSQSPPDLSQQQADMYFPRRGDPHLPVTSSQPPAQRSAIKREATSSPSIPTPDFSGVRTDQRLDGGRPSHKRLAASASGMHGDADEGGLGPSKRYKCPSCDRAFARAYNLKTHLATHDPNRVKSFVCRHAGCGRSFSRKHDLGRHYTSIHGASGSTYGGSAYGGAGGSVNGNMSGEERAAVRGHRAGSGGSAYGGSANGGSTYGGSNRDDGSSSTEGEQTSPVVSSSVSPPAKGGAAAQASNKHKLHVERVWCDGCGRGWIKGTPEACQCDETGATKSVRTTIGSQYRDE